MCSRVSGALHWPGYKEKKILCATEEDVGWGRQDAPQRFCIILSLKMHPKNSQENVKCGTVEIHFFMLHIDPSLSFFLFSLSVLQGKSVRSTSTGWRLRSRRWCWTGRPARASWGPVAWWTASCRRSTPSSSRLTTAAPAPVAPRAKSHTSEWQSAKADRMHECAWGFTP